MPILVHWDESKSLRKRLAEINAGLAPNSGRINALKGDLRLAIEEDNREKLLGYGSSALAGVDRYGKDLAPPADSTIRGWPNRTGRVLAPRGLLSRTITRFRVNWVRQGEGWRLVAGWVGVPWMIYHLQGRPMGSHPRAPTWQLPKRDIGGITPKGFVKVRAAFAAFAKSLLTKGS
jgi:hypothetical protein